LLALVAILTLLCLSCLVYFAKYELKLRLLESRAAYHMSLLRYHGKETKDAEKQRHHANELVSCGQEAVVVLLDEISSLRYAGRYSPGPYELLRQIATARTTEEPVIRQIAEYRSDLLTAGALTEEESLALHTARVYCCDDLDGLQGWLDDVQSPELAYDTIRVKRLLYLMADYLENRLPEDAPQVLPLGSTPGERVNADFIGWWEANKGSLDVGD